MPMPIYLKVFILKVSIHFFQQLYTRILKVYYFGLFLYHLSWKVGFLKNIWFLMGILLLVYSTIVSNHK